MTEIRVKPVWVAVGATREDSKCAHRTPLRGSLIQFTRCVMDKQDARNGWPVCSSHARQVDK